MGREGTREEQGATGQVLGLLMALVQQSHVLQQSVDLLPHVLPGHALHTAVEPHVLLHSQAGSTESGRRGGGGNKSRHKQEVQLVFDIFAIPDSS